jgi:hypothetical protein
MCKDASDQRIMQRDFWAKAVVSYGGANPHVPGGREKPRNPPPTAGNPTEFQTGRLPITVLQHKTVRYLFSSLTNYYVKLMIRMASLL